MMGGDLLHFVVASDVSTGWLLPCRCACSVGAFAPCFAQPPTYPSNVQTSCHERTRPLAVTAFAGGLAANSFMPPGRRRLERRRQAKAEGKTKGGGTWPSATSVCTWGGSGTARFRRRAVYCA